MQMIKLDYRKFVEKLIIEKKGTILKYQNIKFNLRSISQKIDFVVLLNDISFYQFYKNFKSQNNHKLIDPISSKYAKNFSKNKKKIKLKLNLKNILGYFLKNEFTYNLKFFINGLFSKKINLKNNFFFLCFVNTPKLLNYVVPILKKLNLKCIFVVTSHKQRKELKLKKSETILLPSINIFQTSFSYDDEAIIKLNVKSIYKLLSKYKPKFIFTVEGDHPYAASLSLVAKKFKINSICLQWGMSPRKEPKVSFMNMSNDYFISWSKFFSKILKPYNKNTKFLDYGNFNFTNKKNKKNKVLFILQPHDYSLTKKYFQNLYLLASNLANQFSNWKFVVREHPDYKCEDLFDDKFVNKSKKISIEKYSDKTIDNSLSESKLVVGIWSSSLIEGLFYETIPCVLQFNDNFKFYPDFKKENIGLVEKNINKMELKMINLLKNKKQLNNFQYKIKEKNKNIFSKKNGKYSENKIINFLNTQGQIEYFINQTNVPSISINDKSDLFFFDQRF